MNRKALKNGLIGFLIGLSFAVAVSWAMDASDIDWGSAHRDRDFKRAVEKVIDGNCYVDDGYVYC